MTSADALRWGVERNGVPALIYVDNGSGYRNAAMSDEAIGLVGRIGSTMTHSLPYNSQARGVIERLHQTLWVDGAKDLPGYIGAAMDREARAARLAGALEAVADRLTEDAIARDPERFETLVQGKEGMGGIYQGWRRLGALLRGQRFDPRHDHQADRAG